MWSSLKISSGAKLGHDSCIRHCLISLKFEQLTTKIHTWRFNRQNSIEFWARIPKKPLKRRYWWLKNKERKCYFRFVERRFLAAINCTGSAEGALVPVFLRITHWPKSGLPVSPPGLFSPCSSWIVSVNFCVCSVEKSYVRKLFTLDWYGVNLWVSQTMLNHNQDLFLIVSACLQKLL